MTFDVLALGESILDYRPVPGNITIGVNDIKKYYNTEYLVLCDTPMRFSKVRLESIKAHKSAKVYSHLKLWAEHFNNFNYIRLEERRSKIDLDSDRYSYSNNSAFFACVLAYKLGATRINLWGADFVNHQMLSLAPQWKRAKEDFIELKKQLGKKGVALNIPSKKSKLYGVLM